MDTSHIQIILSEKKHSLKHIDISFQFVATTKLSILYISYS